MSKILIAEDDRELSQALCYALKKENYSVICAFTIAEAKALYEKEDLLLILLDVNLPDGEGFSFCRWVKEKKDIPVLFLTARDLEEDALNGYSLGAEDYVTKPFSMKIVLRKISVILSRETKRTDVYDDGFLKIDFELGAVQIEEKNCPITPTEYRILKKLIEHKGQLLTYSVLLDALWEEGVQLLDKHALAVNINRLRKKIETQEHGYISNVYGMGYIWK